MSAVIAPPPALAAAAVSSGLRISERHPAYDKLIKQAKVVTDREQRTVLYKQAQQLLKQQVPITLIANIRSNRSRENSSTRAV